MSSQHTLLREPRVSHWAQRGAGTFLRGVLEKVGIEPQVKRIGKYKSAGDQLLLKDMSEPQREQLTALLEDIYEGFTSTIAKDRNKTVEEVSYMLRCPLMFMQSYYIFLHGTFVLTASLTASKN